MKTKSKILFSISILSILIFSIAFVLNMNNITTLINRLNGITNNEKEEIKPSQKTPHTNIKLVNSPAMGKYKINISNNPVNGYTTINMNSPLQKCLEIINSDNKIILLSSNDNFDNEYFVALLQMLAGDDYDHILDYFSSNFQSNDKETIKTNFDYYYSDLFKLNKNDIPYINLKIPASNYLENNGLSDAQINLLTAKLKENCEK